MMEFKKRELEAEMVYKKALLDIENDEITRLMGVINEYYETKFKTEKETYSDRGNFYSNVQFLKSHVDNSRARMEEINDLEVELDIKEDEL